ncbi:MAG TPA: FAD-dependent oxidoreductase [Bryobacteraceae bacterium]|nr:FAD-dependent oxidoreductase [Bryobacteraceae bacterium]
MLIALVVLLFAELNLFAEGPPIQERFDVVVYGASASGTMVAVAAAQLGVHVALVEPGAHVGGMVSGGLSNSDVENQQQLIGGLAHQFFAAAGAHYHQPISYTFEPHVAEKIFRDMLAKAGVNVLFHSGLAGVEKNGALLTGIRIEGGRKLSAQVFIDSSYEGDLMKAAGVSYVIGRESQQKYNEPLAGRQDLLPGHHQFRFNVSADRAGGGLLPFVVAQKDVAPTGAADRRFQSYCFRLCLTEDPANRLPVTRPQSYDPHRYELARRYLEGAKGALTLGDFLGIVRIPNGKSDVNSTGPVSTDLLGASWEYPEAGHTRRQQIWDEHLTWAQGLIYFLQNDSAVPDAIRTQANRWGLPKDEFIDTGHWPNQLYVREGRRMLGEYFLTEHDLETLREKYDSIGMAGYNIDIREVEWLAHKVYLFPKVINQVFTEGYLSMPVQPWQIPYRALLPIDEQASNLLVTVCISASTVAYASFRMEPNYMIAGESAGVAAALSIKEKTSLHKVDIVELQSQLRANGQILALSDVPPQPR